MKRQDRRRALHARVIDAIERVYADRLAEHVEQLAHHAFRGEVWDKAAKFVEDSPTLSRILKIGRGLKKTIAHLPSKSFLRPISSEGRTNDGADAHLAERHFAVLAMGKHRRRVGDDLDGHDVATPDAPRLSSTEECHGTTNQARVNRMEAWPGVLDGRRSAARRHVRDS